MTSADLSNPPGRRDRLLALAWGLMVTLCVTGYTFGQSNHHVYLLDALRIAKPATLERDWFTNHTLQYHFLFTRLVLGLQAVRLLTAGFFVLYLALAVAMHAAWMSVVYRVGGDLWTYMLSVLLYHLSGGGLGLGVYQFLQDGSFLPSNISSVATLVALALWLDRRLLAASVAVGIAGLFHVNYALALTGFWGLITLWTLVRRAPLDLRRYAVATLIGMGPCLFNVSVAAIRALKQTEHIPMPEFVALYVRLRHEHHHDPLRWPLALWISFLWPLPLAALAARRLPRGEAVGRLNLILMATLAIQAFAFVFAGVWFVSDVLVQMSLFRFSIFPKLISCVYAAWWLLNIRADRRPAHAVVAGCAIVAALLLIAVPLRGQLPTSIPPPNAATLVGAAVLTAWFGVGLLAARRDTWRFLATSIALPLCIYFAAEQKLGVAMPGEDDPDMRALCAWARSDTPPGALFLTPPQDAIFPLDAQRSTVVGFKHVPQLSGELVEWKRRLCDVLDMDVLTLPTPLPRTLTAMADAYRAVPAEHFADVADRYGCDYVIAMRPLGGVWQDRLAYASPAGVYFVYSAR